MEIVLQSYRRTFDRNRSIVNTTTTYTYQFKIVQSYIGETTMVSKDYKFKNITAKSSFSNTL